MSQNSSTPGFDFAGHGDRIPVSGPARRLRALREALRHNRLVRHNLLSERPPLAVPGAPITPAVEIGSPSADCPNS